MLAQGQCLQVTQSISASFSRRSTAESSSECAARFAPVARAWCGVLGAAFLPRATEVKHFAGEVPGSAQLLIFDSQDDKFQVTYNCEGFLQKNADKPPDDFMKLLSVSEPLELKQPSELAVGRCEFDLAQA